MDTFIDQFSDLLAEYNIDVYEAAQIGEDDYRLDFILVDGDMSEIKAKLRLQSAVKKINDLWKPQNAVLSVKHFKLNEKTEDEYDASVIVTLRRSETQLGKDKEKEEKAAPFTEEKVEDSVSVKDKILKFDDTVKIIDDVTGEDITGLDKVYYNTKTKEVVGPEGALEVLKKDPGVKFVDGFFVDEWTSVEDGYTIEDVKDDLKTGWFDLGRDWVVYDPEDLILKYMQEHFENFEDITEDE